MSRSEPVPVPLVPVTSSNLAAVGYDAEASTLYVQFHKQGERRPEPPGPVWRYPGVTAAEHAALMSAESVGFAFNVLKGRVQGERVS